MRRIVLIDGENLAYGLRILLRTEEGRADRSLIENFYFRGLFEELLSDELPSEILWYGARLRVYDDTETLKQKSEEAVRLQASFMNLIQAQKIDFIKVGYLRARETGPCEHCGHRTWHLAEKGVDVGLAVRMVTEADPETELVVVSADTDLLPAFAAARKRGARLMHVGYEHRASIALSSASDSTRTITLPIAEKYVTADAATRYLSV